MIDSRADLDRLLPLYGAARTAADPTACAQAIDAALAQGASLTATDANGSTVLHLIVGPVRSAFPVTALLHKGAPIEARNHRGETPLWLAVQWGNTETLNALLAEGADPNASDRAGQTPLQVAALMGHTATVLRLLEAGADWRAADAKNRTAERLAVARNHHACAHALRAVRERAELEAQAGAAAPPPIKPTRVM